MAKEWDEQLMRSKYHLSTSKRLFENFSNYETKRFLSGCLNEMALSATCLVNSLLIMNYVKDGAMISKDPNKRIHEFKKMGKISLGEIIVESVLKIFEVRHAQKHSPVEMLKQDKILLLDRGEYRAITVERMKELIDNLEIGIRRFEDSVRNS